MSEVKFCPLALSLYLTDSVSGLTVSTLISEKGRFEREFEGRVSLDKVWSPFITGKWGLLP